MIDYALPDRVEIAHKKRQFIVQLLEPKLWQISDEIGGDYGTIVMITAEGPERDPVYGGKLPHDDAVDLWGSDWDAIARAVINQVDADRAHL
jgi:hypothetical protein